MQTETKFAIVFFTIAFHLASHSAASATVAGDQESSTNTTNSTNTTKNRYNVDLKPASQKEQQLNNDTAQAVNRIPEIRIEGKDLQPPAEEVPIHGFHPIKKMLQPVVRLEKNSVQLEQQIMKLEGPIGALQPSMLGLQKKMTSVEQKMSNVQNRMIDVGGHIDNVGTRVEQVGTEMKAILERMSAVRSDIGRVNSEIDGLNGPIKDLHKPLTEVAHPLMAVQQKLEQLAALLTTVLFTILVAAGIIAIGTPVAAILIYRNRRKLFPDLTDREFPVVHTSDSPQSPSRE